MVYLRGHSGLLTRGTSAGDQRTAGLSSASLIPLLLTGIRCQPEPQLNIQLEKERRYNFRQMEKG